jgi:hypothetical protein
MSEGKATCCARIYSRYRSHTCGNAAKVDRGGKLYCGTHDPERREAKRKETEARWRAQSEARNLQSRREAAGREIVRLARLAVRQEASWDDVAEAVGKLEALSHG